MGQFRQRLTTWLGVQSHAVGVGLGLGLACAALVLGAVVAAVGLAAVTGGSDSVIVLAPASPAVSATRPHAQPATATRAPQVVLNVTGTGKQATELFTITGRAWTLNVLCGGAPSRLGRVPIVVIARRPSTGAAADRLAYTCPATGGASSTTFPGTGTFYLHVISASDWEVIVTDIP